jgi:2-haloacid dehalogenase
MWAIFDLNGTLVDPSVLLDPGALGVEALDEANMMAMVTVIAGREATFAPLLDAALRRGLVRAGLDPALAEGAMSRLPTMPAYPDVPEALAALRAGGFSLAVLTQSAVDAAETVLVNAGLRESFDLVLSAPASGAFKPEDLAYRYALEQAGAPPDAWFVAGHWWDVAGASYAGLRTAWISRTDLAYPDAMPAPDVAGPDLASVAALMLNPT